jgi:hypothetical protein
VSFRSLSILSYAWGLHHPIHANLLVPCPERDQYSCPIAPRLCKVFMGYSCYSLEFGSFYLIYDGSSPSSQLQGVTSAELTQSVRLSANGLLMALCSSMYHDRDVDVFITRVVGGQKLKLAWRGELLFVSYFPKND